ncbi:DUF3108 domain-containing protein [Oxalobacteraceae bacterium OTU3CINTB1]|nr:DUF3108 domain-containing protein [Oxalobacteraceae bacterium OTU3CINTB1]
MTIVSYLFQRRRLLVVCAATLALHLAAIDWAGNHLGSSAPRTSPHPPSVMTAQLRLTLPKRVESAPLVDVKPLAPQEVPRPRVKRPPPPRELPPPTEPAPATDALVAIAAMPVPAGDATSADGVGEGAPAGGKDGQARAGAAKAQTGTPPAPAESPTPAPALPAEAPPQGTRRYKVHLPPSAKFDMAVARVDADGTKWTGSASMTWHTDGSRYDASVEAGVSLLVTRVNLLVLRSEGVIDDYGIAPVRVTEKRTRRAETATHFNREQGTITFSASERSYPLLTGAQDKATVPFQLGGIGRADVNQLGGDIDLQVGDEKEATIFRFQLVGEEELNTKMGKLVTWHLTRPPKPGTYSSRLDIWLAPGMNWYPVQMRNTEASGALTTQTVSNITMTESGK